MSKERSFLAPLSSDQEQDGDHEHLDRRLGAKMRELRKAGGLSLQEVADRAGLSVGLISQIERGLTSPSLRSMRLLAGALGVPVERFFTRAEPPDDTESEFIVRPRSRRVLDLSHRGMTIEIISPGNTGELQTFIANLQPGGGSGIELDEHIGEEAGLVLCGRLEMWLGDRHFFLGEGDSFRFDCRRTPHRYRNPGETLTRVHWAITPPLYSIY